MDIVLIKGANLKAAPRMNEWFGFYSRKRGLLRKTESDSVLKKLTICVASVFVRGMPFVSEGSSVLLATTVNR
jgi:hypothetical protein